MTKSESKYFNTAARMDEAFLAILEKKDLEYITVKEICSAAGVNRSTFYLHYETINDLLEESAQYVNDSFLSYMGKDPKQVIVSIDDADQEKLYFLTDEYLLSYLSFIKEHKRLFAAAIKNPVSLKLDKAYSMMCKHIFDPILERFGIPEENRNYMMAFYVHGLMAIVTEWLKGDCKEPIEKISSIMRSCVGSVKSRITNDM